MARHCPPPAVGALEEHSRPFEAKVLILAGEIHIRIGNDELLYRRGMCSTCRQIVGFCIERLYDILLLGWSRFLYTALVFAPKGMRHPPAGLVAVCFSGVGFCTQRNTTSPCGGRRSLFFASAKKTNEKKADPAGGRAIAGAQGAGFVVRPAVLLASAGTGLSGHDPANTRNAWWCPR